MHFVFTCGLPCAKCDSNGGSFCVPAPTSSQQLLEGTSQQTDAVCPENFKSLSKRELIALLCRKPVVFDDADLHQLYSATVARLKLLDCRAREGKSLQEASEFARWCLSSGLLSLFRLNGSPPPLQVSASLIESQIQGLLFSCECAWNKDPRGPSLDKSELESINSHLARLSVQVARMAGEPTISIVNERNNEH